MIASASPPCSPAHSASNTSLAILPEIVPSAMRREQRGQLRRPTPARASMSSSARLSAAARPRPCIQLAASLALRRRRARARRPRSSAARLAARRQRRRVVPPAARSRARSAAPSPRAARAARARTRSIQSASITSGGRSGIGEVAVVLRVFLAAHRRASRRGRGRTARVSCTTRAAVLDQLDLPVHLEVDRLLHEAEAVEVLDLAARAERLRRAGAPTRWRRSGSCLPACCRRRCRSSCTSACSALA